MRFTDLQYVLFLVVAFVVFRLLRTWRNGAFAWLLGASVVFYAARDPRNLFLLGGCILLDYVVGARIAASDRPGTRRAWLGLSVAGNLGALALFKYGDAVLEGLEAVASAAGHPVALGRLGLDLPIGISFFSFQTLSYTIDIYRRRLAPARNLLEFALFVTFFPQLVAGPIVRAAEFLPQLDAPPRRDAAALGEGLLLITVGMVKKLVVGDGIGRALVDPFYAAPHLYNGPEALLADWASYFALYMDFSGYTDIALGSALLFGWRLPENFDRPAFAPSPAEHWRRWHMTLGTFLRDYLYRPLGGSRVSRPRLWSNLFLVFLVSGIWHGAGISYVLMGVYNGVLAATWRLVRPAPSPRPAVATLERLLAFQATALSVALLRPISLERIGEVIAALGRWGTPSTRPVEVWGTTLLVLAVGLHLSPRGWKGRLVAWGGVGHPLAVAAVVVAAGGLCSLFWVGARDFYYFQF